VNIWCSDNNRGDPVGVSYCDLVWRDFVPPGVEKLDEDAERRLFASRQEAVNRAQRARLQREAEAVPVQVPALEVAFSQLELTSSKADPAPELPVAEPAVAVGPQPELPSPSDPVAELADEVHSAIVAGTQPSDPSLEPDAGAAPSPWSLLATGNQEDYLLSQNDEADFEFPEVEPTGPEVDDDDDVMWLEKSL